MKSLKLILSLILGLSVLLQSCSKDIYGDKLLPKPTEITVESKYDKTFVVKWPDFPADVQQMRVRYTDGSTKKELFVTDFSSDLTIAMESSMNEVDFLFQIVNKNADVSEALRRTVVQKGSYLEYVLSNLLATSQGTNISLNWANEENRPLQFVIKYKGIDGDKVENINTADPTRTFTFNAAFGREVVVEISDANNKKVSKTIQYTAKIEVSVYAGWVDAGYVNATGRDARFFFKPNLDARPMGIVADKQGNLFVTDAGNHSIRKIDPQGVVTTFAGNGTMGDVDGTGTNARFYQPVGMAIDEQGNLYVTERAPRIRKITPAGVVTTLVANTNAEVAGITVDKAGNVYYGNLYRSEIKRIRAKDLTVETIISNIPFPTGMAFNKKGDLIVAFSEGNNTIRKFEAETWKETILAGAVGVRGYKNAIGIEANFSFPWGIGIDANDNIYIAGNGSWGGTMDNYDQSIRLYNASTSEVTTLAGQGGPEYSWMGYIGFANGTGTEARFNAPTGVCVDANGIIYVLDLNNNAIRRIGISPDGISIVNGVK